MLPLEQGIRARWTQLFPQRFSRPLIAMPPPRPNNWPEIAHFSSRSGLLEPEEKFKASLPEHVAAILAPKRLLLWRELLAHYQYPDQQVFQAVTEGIRLTGQTPATGMFPPTFKPALRQEADLQDWAPGARARVFDRIRPQGAADAIVHEKTLEEREKGWVMNFVLPQRTLFCHRLA